MDSSCSEIKSVSKISWKTVKIENVRGEIKTHCHKFLWLNNSFNKYTNKNYNITRYYNNIVLSYYSWPNLTLKSLTTDRWSVGHSRSPISPSFTGNSRFENVFSGSWPDEGLDWFEHFGIGLVINKVDPVLGFRLRKHRRPCDALTIELNTMKRQNPILKVPIFS